MNDPQRPVGGAVQHLRAAVHAARRVKARLLYRGELTIGADFRLGSGAVLATTGPIIVGDRVGIARNFHVETSLRVGDDVLVSSNVSLIGNDHDFSDDDRTVFSGGRNPQSAVVIEGDNLIGFGTTIIGDVTIGRGAIVGARSVVTKDVPPDCIVVGSPARVLRRRRTATSAGDDAAATPPAATATTSTAARHVPIDGGERGPG
ncbi:hypothetical protein GCM10027047_34280 [Rhodococcus aerolatus]